MLGILTGVLVLLLLLAVIGLYIWFGISGVGATGAVGASGATGPTGNAMTGISGTTGIAWVYGGGGTTTSTLSWKGSGGELTLTSTPVTSTTGNSGTLKTSTSIPVSIRPAIDAFQGIKVIDNGTTPATSGLLQVGTDGILTITKDWAGTAFTGGGAATGAPSNMNITYNLP